MCLITIAALVLLVTACGSSPAAAPQSTAAPAGRPDVLGPPATLAGTAVADAGQIEPPDPTKFNKTPGYSRMPVGGIQSASILATNTSTRPGRWTRAAPAPRWDPKRRCGLLARHESDAQCDAGPRREAAERGPTPAPTAAAITQGQRAVSPG
jgi:hypothetical protein